MGENSVLKRMSKMQIKGGVLGLFFNVLEKYIKMIPQGKLNPEKKETEPRIYLDS